MGLLFWIACTYPFLSSLGSSCFVLPWLILPCIALCCLVLSCLDLSCPALRCVALCCVVLCCVVLSCVVLSSHILSYLVLSCLVLSCLVMSCLVLSCLVLSLDNNIFMMLLFNFTLAFYTLCQQMQLLAKRVKSNDEIGQQHYEDDGIQIVLSCLI